MITIYGSENCVWCLRAKQLAETFELEHEYKLVSDYQAEFSTKFPAARTVPQIVWDNTYIGGYEAFAKVVNEYVNEGENK
jgi:glutaredoxin